MSIFIQLFEEYNVAPKTIKAKPIANTIKAPTGFIPTRLKGKK